jgi:hypothetical protein
MGRGDLDGQRRAGRVRRAFSVMGGLILNAQVRIYPDAGHGFLWQHHREFETSTHSSLRKSATELRAAIGYFPSGRNERG